MSQEDRGVPVYVFGDDGGDRCSFGRTSSNRRILTVSVPAWWRLVADPDDGVVLRDTFGATMGPDELGRRAWLGEFVIREAAY